uniref:Uncharacterized protein n=1 Tax=Rangifer tarandus platyrhynchus TaxID=3082113 RepID=A0ACB0EZT1_RANTA|nr:unnamed protein product [Rangifer tarandus platyrhynchus]
MLAVSDGRAPRKGVPPWCRGLGAAQPSPAPRPPRSPSARRRGRNSSHFLCAERYAACSLPDRSAARRASSGGADRAALKQADTSPHPHPIPSRRADNRSGVNPLEEQERESQSPRRRGRWEPLPPPPTPASPTPEAAVNRTRGGVGKPRVSPGLAAHGESRSPLLEVPPYGLRLDPGTPSAAGAPRPRISRKRCAPSSPLHPLQPQTAEILGETGLETQVLETSQSSGETPLAGSPSPRTLFRARHFRPSLRCRRLSESGGADSVCF